LPGVVPNNSAWRVLTCADVLVGDFGGFNIFAVRL
jgi:hypothetical protein